MIFECQSFEEFKKKLDAVELLGLDYEIEKKTILTRSIGALHHSSTWVIVAKGTEAMQP